MNAVDQEMLLIKSLDDGASLKFSEYTKQWYIEARIEVSDGCVLTGGTEHADTPTLAVSRYLNYLKAVPLDKVIVTHAGRDDRRHWRWNGAAFTEQPVEWFRDRVGVGRDSESTTTDAAASERDV